MGLLDALLGRGGARGAEAKKRIAEGALLLDVRTPAEFAEGHIDGALNIPVQVLPQRIDELGDRSRPIVVYCRSGMRSANAAQILGRAGYTVHDAGGMSNLIEGTHRGGSCCSSS